MADLTEHEAKSIVEPSDSVASSLYRRYYSTSALADGNLESALAINKAYFRVNFSRHLPEHRDASILEIGCGYGKNVQAMKELGYSHVVGIDFSEEQINVARNKLGLEEAHLGNAIDWLNQSNEEFDCIVLIDVLEHLELSSLVILAEMLESHLKPGGRVIVQVPNGLAPLNPLRYGDLTHLRAFTPQSMAQFFANAGLAARFTGDAVSKNIFKRIFWKGFVSPLMKLAFFVLHGRYAYPLTFAVNLVAVGEKSERKV
ncbi:MAG: methyltransferase domain-containing protein [Gammaproteobacteria bacterium]|nr:methyltransferase domain-containing protein [Gammaproteobacteria bacterium]